MRRRLKLPLWDIVVLLSFAGIIYGLFDLMVEKGIFIGLVLGVSAIVSGTMATAMLYPLWYRD